MTIDCTKDAEYAGIVDLDTHRFVREPVQTANLLTGEYTALETFPDGAIVDPPTPVKRRRNRIGALRHDGVVVTCHKWEGK